jgi:hypothetical protein
MIFCLVYIKILMVFVAVILAVAVPTIGPFIALIGSLCFSILGLICPAMIELVTFWEEGKGPYTVNTKKKKKKKKLLVINSPYYIDDIIILHILHKDIRDCTSIISRMSVPDH